MSINGPWDEDPMWVPDLQDSELADNEIVQVSTFQEILDKYMPLDRTNNIWGYNVNKQFDRWENKDGTLK
jgi:hypothetical protein